MQRLEVSDAVRRLYGSLDVKRLNITEKNRVVSGTKLAGRHALCVESINNNLTSMCDIESK